MRGEDLGCGADLADQPGITPACAGKTTGRSEDLGPSIGSPPHARGRPADALRHRRGRRITPACAGKTNASVAPVISIPDHPRMRGEDAGTARSSNMSIGSPPHARGRLVALNFKNSFERITPACAGKTLFATASSCWVTDHPRMRGEDA